MGPDKGRNTPDGGRGIYLCNIQPHSVYVRGCIHSDCCGVFHRCSTGIADFCPYIDSYSNPVWNFFDSFRGVMVVTLCIGLVTPPVGINLFVASSVGGQPIHKIIPHIPVLIASIIAGTMVIVLIPGISTLLPALMK